MFICEYDYTVAPLDREYITNYAKELFSKHKEISEDHYNNCWRTFIEKKDMTNFDCGANVTAFILNEIKYFCILLHGGLNSEQWYYGKVI